MARGPTRFVVLDNEAARALLSTRSSDPTRATVVQALTASNGRPSVPLAVRVEAGWRRGDPAAANANRLVPEDAALDRPGADRAVELRGRCPTASVVDATVAVAAERRARSQPEGVVEVLTSDVTDLSALAAHSDARIRVKGV